MSGQSGNTRGGALLGLGGEQDQALHVLTEDAEVRRSRRLGGRSHERGGRMLTRQDCLDAPARRMESREDAREHIRREVRSAAFARFSTRRAHSVGGRKRRGRHDLLCEAARPASSQSAGNRPANTPAASGRVAPRSEWMTDRPCSVSACPHLRASRG